MTGSCSACSTLKIGPILTLLSPSLPSRTFTFRCRMFRFLYRWRDQHQQTPPCSKEGSPLGQSWSENPGMSTNNNRPPPHDSTSLQVHLGKCLRFQPHTATASLLITPSGASKRSRRPGKRVPGKLMRGNSQLPGSGGGLQGCRPQRKLQGGFWIKRVDLWVAAGRQVGQPRLGRLAKGVWWTQDTSLMVCPTGSRRQIERLTGWRVRAKEPLKQIFPRSTLQTKGYETFSRMPSERPNANIF